MALSTRELVLILQARDNLSGVLARSGTAINGVGNAAVGANAKLLGLGIAASTVGSSLREAGLDVIGFGQDAVSAFEEANKVAAITATQAQNLGLSVAEVLEIVNNTGSNYGTSLDGLHESLFEILSTIETDVPGAVEVLEALAIAGVARAGTSADFAGVVTASINAFKLETADALPVIDAFFRAVEQGQGTFEGFSSGFATAIPAAQQFDQTFQDTFGSVAFVTKQTGLSAAEAGTAVARAFDLMRKSSGEINVVANLEAIGVAVRDVEGNFRPILPIMRDLDAALSDLTANEKSVKLQEIFGPNVRAFRFLGPALEDLDAFEAVLGEVNQGVSDAGGIWGAFGLQSEELHTQTQLLNNQFQIFKQSIGSILAPAFIELVETAGELIEFWHGLSPATQENIVKFTAIGAAIAVVVGTLASIAGAILTASAVFGFLGTSLTAVVAASLGFVAAMGGVAAIAILIIRNWDTVKSKLMPIFDALVDGWNRFVEVFKGADPKFGSAGGGGPDGIISTIERLAVALRTTWDTIGPILEQFQLGINALWAAFSGGGLTSDGFVGFMEVVGVALRSTFDYIIGTVGVVVEGITSFLNVLAGGSLKDAIAGGPFGQSDTGFVALMERIALVVRTVVPIVVSVFATLVAWLASTMWPGIKKVFGAFIQGVAGIASEILPTIHAIIDIFTFLVKTVIAVIKFLMPIIKPILMGIGELFKTIFNLIADIVTNVMNIISNVIQLGLNIIQGDWSGAWENIKAIFSSIWEIIKSLVSTGWDIIKTVFKTGKDVLINTVKLLATTVIVKAAEMMLGFLQSIRNALNKVKEWFMELPGKIKGWFGNAKTVLKNTGEDIIRGLINGIKNMAGAAKDAAIGAVKGALDGAKSFLRIGSPSKVFEEVGMNTMEGMRLGILGQKGNVKKAVDAVNRELVATTNPSFTVNGTNRTDSILLRILRILEAQGLGGVGEVLSVGGDINIMTSEGEDSLLDRLNLAGV